MTTATKTTLAEELGIKIGDFFVESWGWEQTNIDFYKVVGITPKGVKIQRWTSKRVGTDGYSDKMVPGDTVYRDKIMQKKLGHYTAHGTQTVYLNMTSYSNAYPWNGNAQYQTGAGYGH